MRSLAFMLVWLLGSVAAHAQGFGQSLPFLAKDASSAFVPTDIANLVAWYRADSGVWQDSGATIAATTNDAPISYITDYSGQNNHLTNANSSLATVWLSIGQSNAPFSTIYFTNNGTSSGFKTVTTPTYTNEYWVFAVVMVGTAGGSSDKRLWQGAVLNGSYAPSCNFYTGSDWWGGSTSQTFDVGSKTTWHCLSYRFASTDSLVRTNGVQCKAGSTGTADAEKINQGIVFGAAQALNYAFRGWIAEMLIYNQALNSNSVYQVENYLRRHNYTYYGP